MLFFFNREIYFHNLAKTDFFAEFNFAIGSCQKQFAEFFFEIGFDDDACNSKRAKLKFSEKQ